ncbi:MAG TPA: hypothetical protein VF796_20295 [Humisphaera sp.]
MTAPGPAPTGIPYAVPTDLRPDATVLRDDRSLLVVGMVATGLAALAGVAVVLMMYAGLLSNDPRPAVALLSFGPFGFAFLGWRLIRMRPRMILDPAGLHDLRFGFGFIPWAQVESARVLRWADHRYLCLRVRDPELRRPSLGLHVMMRRPRPVEAEPGEVVIYIGMMDRRPNKVFEAVERYRLVSLSSA